MRTTDEHDREDARRIFEAIARDTLTNGGGTFRRETGAPVALTTGYTVGVGNVLQVGIGWEPTTQAVAERLAYFWPMTAPANAQYVGTWTDNGILYIDHVTVISDLSIALSLARRNGERAVWDNANGASIDVPRLCPCCGKNEAPFDAGAFCDECTPPVTCEDDTLVFVADAPDYTPYVRNGVAYCPHCDADLSEDDSVQYVESYSASIDRSPFGVCVVRADGEATATCRACGGALDYDDVTEG